ncbi:MAG: triose-phosphate isomerase, partial [Candidatus Dormiibacterota bacterium]
MARRPFVAANWKMNPPSAAEARQLAGGVRAAASADPGRLEVALFPPYVWLSAVAAELDDLPIGLGAQDCYWEPSGAYTGEVSVAMLAGWCQWVLVGHSERREHFAETDEDVARKAGAALAAGMSALVCVGEQLHEYEAGRTAQIVASQVRAGLSRLPAAKLPEAELAFAYEPVWAIGSGRTPTPEEVAAVLEGVRAEAA